MESRGVFCPGILRLVYSVLERLALGRAHSGRVRGGPGQGIRSGETGLDHQVLRSGQHILCAGARRGRAITKRPEIFSRRFPAPRSGEALSMEIGMATIYIDDKPYRADPSRISCMPACRWASICHTSAGIRPWARWERVDNARSNNSAMQRTNTGGWSWPA